MPFLPPEELDTLYRHNPILVSDRLWKTLQDFGYPDVTLGHVIQAIRDYYDDQPVGNDIIHEFIYDWFKNGMKG